MKILSLVLKVRVYPVVRLCHLIKEYFYYFGIQKKEVFLQNLLFVFTDFFGFWPKTFFPDGTGKLAESWQQ